MSNIGKRTAQVTWDHPVIRFLNTLTAITSYRIVARQNQFNISDVVADVPASSISYTFPSSLEEFTLYRCEVYARNSFGYGSPSRTLQFTTLQDVPSSPPSDVYTAVKSSTVIWLHWSPPPDIHINGLISYYSVKVQEMYTRKNWTFVSTGMVLRIGSLHPFFRYSFSIVTRTFGNGPYSNPIVARTLEDAPSSHPENVNLVSKTSRSFTISWDSLPYADRNGIIRYHTVTVTNLELGMTLNISTNSTFLTISDVHPYYQYDAKVKAMTISYGPYSINIAVQLDEEAPSSGPTISGFTGNSTSLFLEWTLPSEDTWNGIIREYYIVIEEEISGKMWTYRTYDMHKTAGNLHPDYVYACTVHAITVAMGPPSTPVYILTQEEVPSGAATNISLLDSTSTTLTFSWEEPSLELQNGNITSYECSLYELGNNDLVQTVDSDDTVVIITDLSPHTAYNFQVAAVNGKGAGPHSATFYARTNEDAPGDAPLNITIDEVDSDYVVLSWSPPSTHLHNGIIRHYHVEVIAAKSNFTKTMTTASTSIIIVDLHPYTGYFIRIAAHTVRTGPYSEPIFLQTMPDIPGPPTGLGYSNLTSNSTLLTWKLPTVQERNGVITEYLIHFLDLSTNHSIQIFYTSAESLFVSDLEPFSYYSYSVAAATVVGYGPHSPHYTIKTSEDVPSAAPSNFAGNVMSSTSVSLSWSPPISDDLNGILRGYQINMVEIQTKRTFTLQVQGTHHLVSFLHPYYDYVVAIAASTIGNGPFSNYISVMTHEDVPSSSPEILQIQASSRSVSLSWSSIPTPDQNGIIIGYTVYLTDLDKGEISQRAFTVTSTNFTISDLTPYTTYGLMVSAQTIVGNGPQSNLSAIQTREEAPIGKPTNVTAVTYDATSIHVYWTHPPEDTHYGIIREYWLNVTELETATRTRLVVDSEETEVVLRSLHPYFTYHITIVPVTIEEGDNYTEITIRTKEDAPSSPPRDVVVSELLSRSIILEWSPPLFEDRNGVIRKYLLNITGKFEDVLQNMIILESHNTSLLVPDLHPNNKYIISVSAFTIEEGPFTTALQIATLEDVPSAPPQSIMTSILNSRAVNITWRPPILAGQNGEIISYTVLIEDNNQKDYNLSYDVNGKLLEKAISDLFPYHLYLIRVAASTRVGLGPYSAQVLIEMPEDAPTHPPTDVQVLEVGTHNICLSWNPPPEDFHNGVIRSYTIRVHEVETERSFLVHTANSEYSFLHLHPHYTYNFSVAAVTVSPGPHSPIITAMTLETEPSSSPVNLIVTEITSTSFILLWDPPPAEDHNGELEEYTILLTKDTDIDYLEYSTDENYLTVENLKPYSKYNIILAASTHEGIGPFSEVLTMQTEEDAPAVPPSNVTIEAVSSTSVQLQWSSPRSEELNGELIHFVIKVLEEDTDTESSIISPTTRHSLDSLHPYYAYHISITAVTILPGPYSEEIVIRTLEDAPTAPPFNISVRSLSSTSINVLWYPPLFESRNGIIRQYTCLITAHQPWINISQTLVVNGTEINLTELIPHTTYHVRVQAVTVLPGPYSASIPSATFEAAPSRPPGNISVTINATTVVQVTWITPPMQSLNGIIRHFVLELYERNSTSENFMLYKKIQRSSSPSVIDDLHPFYDYSIFVAVETVGLGPYSELYTWKMPEDAPSSPPINTRVSNVTSSEMLLQWMPPALSNQNGIIRQYFIQLLNTNTGQSENYTVSGGSTSLLISSLHPAHTYVIEVAAISILQGPFSDDVYVTMKEDVPTGPPHQLNIQIKNASHIEAFWHPPIEDLQNGVIILYELNISIQGQQVHQIHSNTTRVVLPLLLPYSEYSISVAASTHVGTGPYSTAVIFNTPETAPSGSPNNISINSITSTSFAAQWMLPLVNLKNGLVRYFVVKLTENETQTRSEIHVYDTMKEFVGLHPYYTYVLEVAAYTVGLGPYSSPVITITLEAAPSAPPRAIGIIYVASRWFNASWESPLTPERNGVIIYYHISLRQNNSLNEPHVVFTTDSNPSISISSVLPYRVYFLTIAAFTIEQGPLSNPVVFQTLEDAPTSAPLNFEASNITSRNFLLSWSAPEEEQVNGILRLFHLSVSERKSSLLVEQKLESNMMWYELEELNPFTVYECSVSGITVDEGPLSYIQVKTAQEAPGLPPESVTVQVHDSHTMTVTWMPPTSEHNGIIVGYNITVTLAYSDSLPVQYFTNSTSMHLNGLIPYSTYHVEVAAVTVAVGPYSDYVYAIIPEAAPYTAPQNLSISISSSTAIQMSWQLPPDGHINGIVRHFHVMVVSVADSAVTHSDIVDHATLETQIEGLHPNYQYWCSVSAVTTEEGPAANMSITMSTDVPSGPPMSVQILPTDDRTLTILWEAPDPSKQNGIIQYYVIKVITLDNNHTEIINNTERSLILTNMHPFYTYSILLAATTSVGLGPFSDPAYYLAPQSRPSCPVHNVTASIMTSSSVCLSWTPPTHSCWNGIITNYTITTLSLGPQNTTILDRVENNTDSAVLTESRVTVFPDAENELINYRDPRSGMLQSIVTEKTLISDLQPFFKYIFAIYMSNAAGNGNSTSSQVISLPGREPTAPPSHVNVLATSSTSISLSWNPPSILQWNGVISGYTVRIHYMPSMAMQEIQYYYKEYHQECHINGLKPYSNYSVAVTAVSDFGVGIYSKNTSVQTMEDVPGQPLNLTVENVSSVYVISWKPPTHPNGIILGYEISYSVSSISFAPDVDDKMEHYSEHTQSLQFILTHGEPKRYMFKVRAHTTIGYGEYSKEIAAPMNAAQTKSAAKSSDIAAGIGWTIVGILFILAIIIYIGKKYVKKNKRSTQTVEMMPNAEWKENELYQDSETVAQRYGKAKEQVEQTIVPPGSLSDRCPNENEKLTEEHDDRLNEEQDDRLNEEQDDRLNEEQDDRLNEEENCMLINTSSTHETLEATEVLDDSSAKPESISENNELEGKTDEEGEHFDERDNDSEYYVNADTERMIK